MTGTRPCRRSEDKPPNRLRTATVRERAATAPCRDFQTQPPNRGGALLAVLWLAAALSAIAFSVANTVRTETERTATSSEGLRTYYLASGSIDRAILWLQWGVLNNPDGSPKYYRSPMPYMRYSYPSGVAIVEVIPETSKVNLNTAPPEQLDALLRACGADQFQSSQIVAGIIDWRSGTPAPPGLDFVNPNQTFRPRHASFEEIEEVLLVRGMTPDLFYGRFDRSQEDGRLIPLGGLRDAITTYGGQGNQVDVNSAAPVLMAGLGLPQAAINAIIQRRLAKPFQSMEDVATLIGGSPAIGRMQVASGPRPFWTLRATARLRTADGRLSDLSRTVSATIAFLPPQQATVEPPFHILRWHDEAASVASSALPF